MQNKYNFDYSLVDEDDDKYKKLPEEEWVIKIMKERLQILLSFYRNPN